MIDAHQHFWTRSRGDYHWLEAEPEVLQRDFGPEDLRPLLAEYRIDGTILVQAASTEAETAFMLSIAETMPEVLGVVGWVDFERPDAPERVAHFAEHHKIVGLRPTVADFQAADWFLRPELAPGFEAMVENGMTFDALSHPQHLAPLAELKQRYPDLPIIIDHFAKPEIRNKDFDVWSKDIRTAALSGIWCKLSGLATEAAPDWTVQDLKPYVDHVLSVFGSTRVVWGSDWPVVDAAGGYGRWREAALTLISHLPPSHQDAILDSNARAFYLGE